MIYINNEGPWAIGGVYQRAKRASGHNGLLLEIFAKMPKNHWATGQQVNMLKVGYIRALIKSFLAVISEEIGL